MSSFSLIDFYKDAMDIFIEAGHTISKVPLYFNHSVKQVIYFDTEKTLLIDNNQRYDLENAIYISHLFDIGDDLFPSQKHGKITYYSIVIDCENISRSQIAHKTHMLLHPAFEANISIILFRHNDAIMLSVIEYGSDVILSDWYNIYNDYDNLIERLHISNLSMSSIKEFVADLIYCTARFYYFQSVLGNISVDNLLPEKFFLEADISIITTGYKETIKETIREICSAPQRAYGDDYIEPNFFKVEFDGDIDIELELLSLELESENKEDLNDDFCDTKDDEETVRDEYEFNDVNPELFRDAIRLAKWLEKNDVLI